MILYFDSFITDVPLHKNFVDPNTWIRNACAAYAMPSKVDIAKYSLASYALYPWSHVLIKYQVADTSRSDEFETYARSLFPHATILKGCSNNQSDYRASLALLNNWDDNWIWYAPNNDHPITTHDQNLIDRLLTRAERYQQNHQFISIPYSHLSEYVNLPRPGSAFWHLYGKDTTIIDEDEDAITCVRTHGDNTAVQIVNKALLNHWFNAYELGDARVFRSEDVRQYFYAKKQILVISKKEIGAHFDGYSHTIGGLAEITPQQVPPLFIPRGFFQNDIRIKYGFPNYDPAFTNINPCATHYSFENQHHGTDLKLSLDRLPLFWKTRIHSITSYEKLNTEAVSRAIKRLDNITNNPYKVAHKEHPLTTIAYALRRVKHQAIPYAQNELRRRYHSVLRKCMRLLRLHPLSLPYVCGDNFRALAKHVHDMDRTINPEHIQARDVVFVQSPRMDDFFTNIHPRISVPYVLITHNGDENITAEYLPYLTDTIIHWFAQNTLIKHPKITPIPIGIENKWYYLHGIPRYFNTLRTRPVTKEHKILYKFSIATNPKERGAAHALLDLHPLAHTYSDWRQSYDYLTTLQQFSFVASPPGNGEDCIRTWEAMYLGTIPIVKRSALTEHFMALDLPLVLIDDWQELQQFTPEKLKSLHATMQPKFAAPALWAHYWTELISSKHV